MMIAVAAPVEPQIPVFSITNRIIANVVLLIDAKYRIDRFDPIIPINMERASINRTVFMPVTWPRNARGRAKSAHPIGRCRPDQMVDPRPIVAPAPGHHRNQKPNRG